MSEVVVLATPRTAEEELYWKERIKKILVIGNPNAGKTTWIAKYILNNLDKKILVFGGFTVCRTPIHELRDGIFKWFLATKEDEEVLLNNIYGLPDIVIVEGGCDNVVRVARRLNVDSYLCEVMGTLAKRMRERLYDEVVEVECQ